MSSEDELRWEDWSECWEEVMEAEKREEKSRDSKLNNGSLNMERKPASNQYTEVLQKSFGHSSFRPIQWEVIQSIIEDRRDNCVIMATGYGKSLTYQYPAVYTKGLSVVISPLISLMQDQVLSLKMANIPAAFLGSAQKESAQVKCDLFNNKLRVLYITPEYCVNSSILEEISEKLNLTLVAIDEAHCVSQWGHDFRNDYRKLGNVRQALPNVPFLAVTATATPTVRKDICTSLCLKNPKITCSSFDRPNLYLSVSSKTGNPFLDLKKFMVKSSNNRSFKFDGPTIIYCPTVKLTEEVFSVLKDHHIVADYYHAKRKQQDRNEVHEKFLRDELNVIVATVAFGMGIDKPDVRNVIHWGVPKDIESYYQEIGRAGRDGQPSKCHVFFNRKDFAVSEYLRASQNERLNAHRREMGRLMERYLDSTACRRQSILTHFEGKIQTVECKENCCDNCTFAKNKKRTTGEDAGSNLHDFSEDAELLLGAVKALNGRGLNKIIACLKGSKSSQYTKNSSYGKGKHKSEEWWKGLGRLLICEKYINQTYKQFESNKGFPLPVVYISGSGENLLFNLQTKRADTKLMLAPGKEMLKLIARKKSSETSTESNSSSDVILSLPSSSSESNTMNSLYHYLLRVRKDRANELECAPFHLASNQALIDLSSCRPSSITSLKEGNFDGFTDIKIMRDGKFWVDHIVDFCKKNGLELDVGQNIHDDSSPFTNLPLYVQTSYEKFQKQQMTLEEVMAEKNIARTTLIGHLCQALKVGAPLDLARAGVEDVTLKLITNVITSPPINSNVGRLKPIKEQCPDFITYDQIHIVVAYLTGCCLPKKQANTESAGSTTSSHTCSTQQFSAAISTANQVKGFIPSSKELASQKTLQTMWASESTGACNSQGKPSSSLWKDQFSMIDVANDKPNSLSNISYYTTKEESRGTSLKETKVTAKEQFDGNEALDVSLVNWDEDFFEETNLNEEISKVEILKDTKKQCIDKESSSDGIQRSSSLCEASTASEDETVLTRSLSLDPPSDSVPKRKLPQWLSKPTPRDEARKKMKSNTLFKL